MNTTEKFTRRSLLARTGLAGAAAISGAPALLFQRNPNDRIGVAAVGVGTRGIYLLEQFQGCPNTEIRVICDLYDGNLRRAEKACTNKKAVITKEWEKAVSSPDVDAVFVATPDFWHAPMTIRAAQNKKHVYVEKALCRTLEEAKGIRKAVKDNKVTLQLGHHQNSDPYFMKGREIYKTGQLGKVALARTYIDRTSPWPEWQFYTAYNIQEPPKDATAQTIDWNRFVANASKRPFDVERFFRWRCWWEYGTGIAGDLMSHQWDGVNMIMGLGIPESAITQGSLYFWKQDREVPDQWHVLLDYPKKETAVTFACTFNSRHHGTNTYFFGRDATLEVHDQFCRLYGAEWKPEYGEKLRAAQKAAVAAGRERSEAVVAPDYAMKRGEIEVSSHMRDFIDCLRSGQTPRCGIDRAWEEAVTVVMSVESFFKERKVKWDPVKELIV
jgi:predicted dehydrogenase